MVKRILVVGLGRFGTSLAESLSQQGCEVVAVDSSMQLVDGIKDKVSYALEMDATDPEALRAIEPASCQVAVVAVGENFEVAVLSVAALREAGVPTVIARAMGPRHARILQAVGAHRVIQVETEMGKALGSELAGLTKTGVDATQGSKPAQ